MTKNIAIGFFTLFLCALYGSAQETLQDIVDNPVDTLNQKVPPQEVTIEVAEIKKHEIDPLAPSRAAFYSAILPGLGQIYNRKYWKLPIVYATIGIPTYFYLYNDDYYDRFRTAFKRRKAGFTDDEFYDINNNNSPGQDPDLDIGDLQTQQERFQRDRDLSLVIAIAFYALNIVDANVDAHLKQFNIDEDLSLDINFEPYYDYNQMGQHNHYGMAMSLKF